MMIDLTAFKSPKVGRAYEYWLSKSVGGALPSRADIKPRELVGVLDQLFLIDVTRGPLTFTFRLVGTQLTKWAGVDYTGLAFSARSAAPNWRIVVDDFRNVVETGLPRRDQRSAPWVSKEFYRIERLIAPLSSDGVTVDKLFGAIQLL